MAHPLDGGAHSGRQAGRRRGQAGAENTRAGAGRRAYLVAQPGIVMGVKCCLVRHRQHPTQTRGLGGPLGSHLAAAVLHGRRHRRGHHACCALHLRVLRPAHPKGASAPRHVAQYHSKHLVRKATFLKRWFLGTRHARSGLSKSHSEVGFLQMMLKVLRYRKHASIADRRQVGWEAGARVQGTLIPA